jgi:hypothetical protein
MLQPAFQISQCRFAASPTSLHLSLSLSLLLVTGTKVLLKRNLTYLPTDRRT